MDGRGRTGKFRRGSTLRRGSRGEHVRRLQERLRKLGFDPGPVDGVYGYLTMGAVRDFQRHYGLIPDGVAGRRVLAAMSDDELTDPRRWIVAAELHPETGRTAALRAMTRHAAALSAVSVPVDVATPAQGDGPLAGGNSEQTQESVRIMMGRISGPDTGRRAGGGPACWTTLHNRKGGVPGLYRGEPRATLQAMLHTREGAERLGRWAEAAAGHDEVHGLHLDLGRLRWGDGARFLGIVKKTARLTAEAGKRLVVSLPLQDLNQRWTRLTNDVDYAAVAASAHRVVLAPPAWMPGVRTPRPPSVRELAACVRAVVRHVPPWRCLLGVNVGALVLDGQSARIVSHQRALAAAYNGRIRPEWDEASSRPMVRCRLDGRDVVIWLETAASFGPKVEIVRRFRLGGVYLTSVGAEDVRLWRVLRERLAPHRSTAS